MDDVNFTNFIMPRPYRNSRKISISLVIHDMDANCDLKYAAFCL